MVSIFQRKEKRNGRKIFLSVPHNRIFPLNLPHCLQHFAASRPAPA